MYSEELEEDTSEEKYESIADEGLSGKTGDWPAPPDFEDNECEPKGLYCACECEDERELSAAEL